MRGSLWMGLLAWTALAVPALAASPARVEKLERGGYLEVGSDKRVGDQVSFNYISLADYDVQRGDRWTLDMAWRRNRITLSCDWRMIIAQDFVDASQKGVLWPVADLRSYGGGTFVPYDGDMGNVFQRFCGMTDGWSDPVAFDKVMAEKRAMLPKAVDAPASPKPSLKAVLRAVKNRTPLPDQHFWDFGPAAWRRMDAHPKDPAIVFVNAARIAILQDTRSAWVFMVPPPKDPEDAEVTRDAAMRQYQIDCATGEVELIGQTVWWAAGGNYPESDRLGSTGPALDGSLTGRLKETVCTMKLGAEALPSMDAAYKSVVGRSRWFW